MSVVTRPLAQRQGAAPQAQEALLRRAPSDRPETVEEPAQDAGADPGVLGSGVQHREERHPLPLGLKTAGQLKGDQPAVAVAAEPVRAVRLERTDGGEMVC